MDYLNNSYSIGEKPLEQLLGLLACIVQNESYSVEVRYRANRLFNSLRIAQDKFFIKTPKAKMAVDKSIELVREILFCIDSDDDSKYTLITELENVVGSLLKLTYEFRIKAG